MSPIIHQTHAALAAFVVSLFGMAWPIEAEDQVDLGSRLRVLDACFDTKLTEARKTNQIGKEAGEMLVKLFKAEDLFQRISCLEGREMEHMMAENKDSPLTPYKSGATGSRGDRSESRASLLIHTADGSSVGAPDSACRIRWDDGFVRRD